jgi:ketosteroid isomerase-like protein
MPSAAGGSVVSEQNLAIVRQIYDAWDDDGSAREFIAEDVEYVNPSYAVEPGTRVGRKSFAVVRDTYEDFKIRVERFIDAGGDDVVVLARYTASGTVSRVPLEGEHGYVWTLREGQAVRFQWFMSHAEALEAAGLSESA